MSSSSSSTEEMSLADLKNIVREYVRIDNQMRGLSRELSSCRQEKKKTSAQLVQIMRDNKLDIFQLRDGQLAYVRKNVKKPITQKQLLTILGAYFEGDAEKANEVGSFIMENREETTRETIKRKINVQPGPSAEEAEEDNGN